MAGRTFAIGESIIAIDTGAGKTNGFLTAVELPPRGKISRYIREPRPAVA